MLSGQLTLASSPLFGGVGIQPPLTGVQGVHASHGNAQVWAEVLAGKSAPATRLRQSSVHNSRSIDPPEGSRDVTPTPRRTEHERGLLLCERIPPPLIAPVVRVTALPVS